VLSQIDTCEEDVCLSYIDKYCFDRNYIYIYIIGTSFSIVRQA
jgi:hypothetical protein